MNFQKQQHALINFFFPSERYQDFESLLFHQKFNDFINGNISGQRRLLIAPHLLIFTADK